MQAIFAIKWANFRNIWHISQYSFLACSFRLPYMRGKRASFPQEARARFFSQPWKIGLYGRAFYPVRLAAGRGSMAEPGISRAIKYSWQEITCRLCLNGWALLLAI